MIKRLLMKLVMKKCNPSVKENTLFTKLLEIEANDVKSITSLHVCV